MTLVGLGRVAQTEGSNNKVKCNPNYSFTRENFSESNNDTLNTKFIYSGATGKPV